ncbi:hypothetical protein PsorP6_001049 [Peronosclerospora sorghi]|uniref:Uncharacterized protein n=1 Tax=Peronosclerospora sorghi TaxID=230839 RepID=A0ACC0WVC5_9STRA|nr:hypothetical protein PsorP6_001049 [Peronosclerospora sorghi]
MMMKIPVAGEFRSVDGESPDQNGDEDQQHEDSSDHDASESGESVGGSTSNKNNPGTNKLEKETSEKKINLVKNTSEMIYINRCIVVMKHRVMMMKIPVAGEFRSVDGESPDQNVY